MKTSVSLESNGAHATPLSARQAAQRLRELGQRVTTQRVAILTLFVPNEHLTADEAIERLAAHGHQADRSTVYRGLEHFRDLGLLSEIDLGDGLRRFELIGDERHHHMTCLACRGVIEIADDLVAPMRRAIAERHGFAPRIDHLALFGLCSGCQVEGHTGETPEDQTS